jgi:hypothetical protein
MNGRQTFAIRLVGHSTTLIGKQVAMTTRPADSVFGVPQPPWGVQGEAAMSHLAGDDSNPLADDQTQPGTPVQWVNTELHEIASTIEALQNRLEEANSRLSTVERVETTEFEIGRLFVQAQRFSEASLSELEGKIHEVLGAAEAKAKQILEEATFEAQEIRREAQEAAFASTRTVRELQLAIAGFTTVNSELLKELGTLNRMLFPGRDPEAAEFDPSSPAEVDSIEPG